MMAYQLNGAKNHQDLSASHTGSSSGTDITAAKLSLDGVISRVDGEQDHGGSTAGTVLQSYSYLGLGTIVQEVDSNGMELTYIHQSGDTLSGSDGGDRYTGLDRFGRVVDQWWYDPSTSTTLERLQYGYDPDGNVLYINNLITSSQSELFHANSSTSGDDATAYDGLNRLTNFARGTLSASSNNGSTLDTVASPSTTQSWSLDAIGNWTADTGGANGSETRTSNADNEITSSNGTTNESPTYDHNGNMTYDGVNNTYVYDAWNRIVSMKQGATALENRTYYADRAMGASSDTCEGVITHMYYSSDWQVIEEQTYSGGAGYVVSAQYVWGQGYTDQMVERDDNSTSGSLGLSGSGLGRRIFAVQDVNHDVTALADLNAVVLARFTYGPYGNGFNGTPYGWLYQFQGGRIDPVTGLYNFRNRDYNAGLGVWMEQDPTGYGPGEDLYQFDAGSPASLIDPTGFAPQPPITSGQGKNLFYKATKKLTDDITGEASQLWTYEKDHHKGGLGGWKQSAQIKVPLYEFPEVPNAGLYLSLTGDLDLWAYKQSVYGHTGLTLRLELAQSSDLMNSDKIFTYGGDFYYKDIAGSDTKKWTGFVRFDIEGDINISILKAKAQASVTFDMNSSWHAQFSTSFSAKLVLPKSIKDFKQLSEHVHTGGEAGVGMDWKVV